MKKYYKNEYPVDFNQLDIIDIAQRLSLNLQSVQGGRQYLTHCWVCDDKSKHGKLAIHQAKSVFRCARCGYSGNLYTMTCDLLGGSNNALQFLKNEYSSCSSSQVKIKTARRKQILKEEITAPIEIKDAVYQAFLQKLVLYQKHRENLLKRGLSNDVIDNKEYKSTLTYDSTEGVCYLLQKEGYPLKGVPGFYEKDGKWVFMTLPGFLIPVRDVKGRIQAMQIRVDEEVLKKKGDLQKYLWHSSAGKTNGVSSGSPVHIVMPNKPIQNNTVYITEGPLKADIASYLLEVPFIGIAGVGMYKQAVDVAVNMGVKTAPILFDMDKLENIHVKNAESKLIQELSAQKIKAFPITWNAKIGKGIDDVLVTHNEEFKQFLFESVERNSKSNSTRVDSWINRRKNKKVI